MVEGESAVASSLEPNNMYSTRSNSVKERCVRRKSLARSRGSAVTRGEDNKHSLGKERPVKCLECALIFFFTSKVCIPRAAHSLGDFSYLNQRRYRCFSVYCNFSPTVIYCKSFWLGGAGWIDIFRTNKKREKKIKGKQNWLCAKISRGPPTAHLGRSVFMSLGGTWFILSIYSLLLPSSVYIYIYSVHIALYSNRTLVERERGPLGYPDKLLFRRGRPHAGASV